MIKGMIITCLVVLCHINSMAQYRFVKYYDNNNINKSSDQSKDFFELDSGGYIFTNMSTDFYNVDTLGFARSYFQIIQTDGFGNIMWNKNYRKPKFSVRVRKMEKMSDNNYLLAGNEFDLVKYYNDTTGSFILLVKINQNGDTLWTKTLNIGDGDEFVEKVIHTNDKGFAIIGQVCDKKETNCDMYLMKLDSNAKLMWYKTFTWDAKFWERPTSLIQSKDNMYYLTGRTLDIKGQTEHGHLVKTDSNGNLLWQKKLDNEGYIGSYIYGIVESSDNSILLAGAIGNNTPKGWLLRIDTSGNYLMNKKVGEENERTFFTHVFEKQNTIFVHGDSESHLIKPNINRPILYSYTKDGILNWGRVYEDSLNGIGAQIVYCTKPTKDGGFAMVGFGDSPQDSVHNQDVLFIKVDKRGCLYTDCPSVGIEEDKEGINSSLIIYPNPSNGMFRVKTNLSLNMLEVYNTLGSRVKLLNNFTSAEIDLSNLSKGIYLLRFRDQDGLYYTERLSIE